MLALQNLTLGSDSAVYAEARATQLYHCTSIRDSTDPPFSLLRSCMRLEA